MPRTNIPRAPISIRLPVRRQTASLAELWRNNLRTSRLWDGVPRLLTSLQVMGLLDLRELPEESGRRRQQDRRTKRIPSKQNLSHSTETARHVNAKAH